ncbi:MAG: hypothetical protein JWN36_1799, partial [Microbacteriaceae bacterium]|nr:hypothetical protein [Microbacteriaceae bacterium]
MTYPSRPYVFRPRPRHRETLDSYSNRVLTANAETAEHRAHLTTLERKNNPQLTRVEAWKQALARKLERDTLDLTANPAGWLTHRDGTSCLHCAALLGPRVLCTLCAHGERIEQHPHFDGMVCVRHRRWVGLGDNPSLQHPVDDACIKTEHHFRRLKRENRIDVRLYLTVITAQWPSGLGSEAELPARFPVAIAIIAALTTRQFTRRFFDPANTYAQAFAYLNDTLRKVFGEPAENLAREVWLYARATFWTIRASVQAGAIEPAVWHHDYPLDSDILQSYIDNG